jgi:hypothetical protein
LCLSFPGWLTALYAISPLSFVSFLPSLRCWSFTASLAACLGWEGLATFFLVLSVELTWVLLCLSLSLHSQWHTLTSAVHSPLPIGSSLSLSLSLKLSSSKQQLSFGQGLVGTAHLCCLTLLGNLRGLGDWTAGVNLASWSWGHLKVHLSLTLTSGG